MFEIMGVPIVVGTTIARVGRRSYSNVVGLGPFVRPESVVGVYKRL